MTKVDLKNRTKAYSLSIVRLVQEIPGDKVANVLGRQLLRAATSVGANYRAACRARSTPDFIYKLKIVEEECDESLYWLELMRDAALVSAEKLKPLLVEGDEILAIIVSSLKTSRQNLG